MVTVYTYSSQLEVNSSRFNQPGDFFVYVVFLFAVILVSCVACLQYLFDIFIIIDSYSKCQFCLLVLPLLTLSEHLRAFDPRISARPAILAEAVPGNEED